MYKVLIRPVFFLCKPETVHHIVFTILKILNKLPLIPLILKNLYQINDYSLKRTICGMEFNNPVGLAAGLDKDAEAYDMLGYFGFSHIEIGTVTPKAQPGNPKPRLFRIIQDEALINRMGFNNKGVEQIIHNLKRKKSDVIIGGNIGKNKVTPNEKALEDYLNSYEALYPYVNYFVINVSSPNTPNLRELQDKEPLTRILQNVYSQNQKKSLPKPLFLKIAPDLTDHQLDDIIEIVQLTNIDGIIATNTTIQRHNLTISAAQIEAIGNGGLSGIPLKSRSTQVISYIYKKSEGQIPIIGVGGIFSANDAIEKLEAGASLVQIYTAFIYEGPGIVRKINKELVSYFRSK